MSNGWALLWQDPHLLLTRHADVGLPGGLPGISQPCAHGQQWLLLPGSTLGRAARCSRRRDSGGLAGVSDSPCPQLSVEGFDSPMPSTTTPSGASWHPVPTGLVTGASLLVPRNIRSPALLPLLARTNWQHLLQTREVPWERSTQPAPSWGSWSSPGPPSPAPGSPQKPGLWWGGVTSSGESVHFHRPRPARGVYITHSMYVYI